MLKTYIWYGHGVYECIVIRQFNKNNKKNIIINNNNNNNNNNLTYVCKKEETEDDIYSIYSYMIYSECVLCSQAPEKLK